MRRILSVVLLVWITLARGEGKNAVTCGSAIKLRNPTTGRHIHSLQVCIDPGAHSFTPGRLPYLNL